MEQETQGRLEALVERLRQDPTLAERLPSQEAAIVREALAGESVYTIAQQQRISEEAVWSALSSAARAASGAVRPQVESGGLGSDPGPGGPGFGD